MTAFHDFILAHAGPWLALGGGLIGFVFGAIVTVTNFCTMGALSDIQNLGDWRRMRAWIMAAAVAMLGAQALEAAGIVELSRSMYLAPNLNIAGHLIGGFLFGVGMVMAGGCASRNLTRIGGGDLRALLTLVVVGLAAFATIGGILGPARALLEQTATLPLPLATQSLGDAIAALLKIDPSVANRSLGFAIGGLALAYCLGSAEFRASPAHVGSGLGVGLCVVAGWALTGLAFDELAPKPAPPISLTFVRPAGDTLEWITRYTAAPMPGFGVASVLGAILGSFAVALATGRFRISTFANVADTRRNLGGGVLMGVGGVLALGCTVGQGITGLSTLAIGSFLTFVAIVAGGFYGLRLLERWLMAEA